MAKEPNFVIEDTQSLVDLIRSVDGISNLASGAAVSGIAQAIMTKVLEDITPEDLRDLVHELRSSTSGRT